MTLSRLVLSVLALVFAHLWHVPSYTAVDTDTPQLMIRSGPDWLSQAAAVVLLVTWIGLEATTRLDPGWRQTVRRRRMMGRPPVTPDLASVPVAQVTGVAAGIAAVSAGLLLVAEPLPEYLGDLTYLSDPTYTYGLGSTLEPGPLVAIEIVTLTLLAVGLLAVGTPAAVGRTLLAAATAGLAAALVTAALVSPRLYGFTVQYVIWVVVVWVLVMLAVGGLAATPVWYRLRRRLVGLVRRRSRPG
ncbi:hypothetical protein [Geodermatophilus maliterrae]|uniref:Uncharacterized protein n=1 Tax=Geodermatophilus maliterrae TaxID=3162531 RepID=A0ABV3X8H8_9ACTN